MTDTEKAKLLLSLVDQTNFPGKERKTIVEIAEWLEAIRDGKITTKETECPNS
jgi:hypothetical protein